MLSTCLQPHHLVDVIASSRPEIEDLARVSCLPGSLKPGSLKADGSDVGSGALRGAIGALEHRDGLACQGARRRMDPT